MELARMGLGTPPEADVYVWHICHNVPDMERFLIK